MGRRFRRNGRATATAGAANQHAREPMAVPTGGAGASNLPHCDSTSLRPVASGRCHREQPAGPTDGSGARENKMSTVLPGRLSISVWRERVEWGDGCTHDDRPRERSEGTASWPVPVAASGGSRRPPFSRLPNAHRRRLFVCATDRNNCNNKQSRIDSTRCRHRHSFRRRPW